jgi:membrane-bound serine protease (ClpP class)
MIAMFKNIRRNTILILPLILLTVILSSVFVSAQNDSPLVLTIEINNTITAGTTEYIRRSLETAEEMNADAIVLLIDTPGGLVSATIDIMRLILNSNTPVITYVYPQGAIAASAGSFILLSGNIAAMSPGTTCGAAMPVIISPTEGTTQTADDKTIKFLAGHMRSIARERGRSTDVADKFVTENLTLDAYEALEKNVIDYIPSTLEELLETIHGTTVKINNENIILNTKNANLEPLEMTIVDRITDIVSNPQITFILVIVGIYGIIIGFNAPGTFVPEVLGAIALMLGLYGLGLFEVNIFAAAMLLLGIALLVAEAFTPTFGILAFGGIVSIVLGILFLPVEPLMPAGWFRSFRLMAIGIGIGSGILMVIILTGIIRLRKSKVIHGNFEFDGKTGTVVDTLDPKGLVKVQGEIWSGTSSLGDTIETGERIVVIKREGINVIVKKTNNDTDIKSKEV